MAALSFEETQVTKRRPILETLSFPCDVLFLTTVIYATVNPMSASLGQKTRERLVIWQINFIFLLPVSYLQLSQVNKLQAG